MDVTALARELYEAERNVTPLDPLTTTYPGITVEDAYAIQMAGVELRKTLDGRRVVGKKLGLTSRAMQKLLGVNEPDYGHLLDHVMVNEGEPLTRKDFLLPKVEGEIAFVMKHRLMGPGVTVADVMRATEGVMAAIEIVDSRVRDWKIKLPDTIADAASGARVVLGSRLVPLRKLNLRLVGMVLEKNGEVVNTGAGAAVWGNPAAAMAWLANKLGSFGVAIEAGEVVISGAVTAAADANAGDSFLVSFDGGLGSVGCRFV